MTIDRALDAAIIRALAEVPGVTSSYLFGSAAAGRTHRESDIDVAILLDRRVYPSARARFDARLRAHAALGPALRRDDIDVVVLNDAPPLFSRRIVAAGRRLACADPEADREFRRDTMLRAADLAPFLARAHRRVLDALAGTAARRR
jgi:uncharacterized protein